MHYWKHNILLFLTILFSLNLFAEPFERRRVDTIPSQVESMYQRGLRFLAQAQSNEGMWEDRMGTEAGVVGLCIIAFLAHGEDPNYGPYSDNISLAIDYLIGQQDDQTGYIGTSMYNHGFATLALAECYGMVDDDRIASALQGAVNLILSAQKVNSKGAWRYSPESTDADSTVTGCQIKALYAARNAGISVPDESLEKAATFMKSCQGSDGSYGYVSAGSGKPTLTAIGVLSQALGKNKESDSFKAGVEHLKKQLNFRDKIYPYYFEYYMSQALFQADEDLWQTWNLKNIRYLSTIQNRDGFWPGDKGAAFSTAGALLSLALNYRFLPIYEK